MVERGLRMNWTDYILGGLGILILIFLTMFVSIFMLYPGQREDYCKYKFGEDFSYNYDNYEHGMHVCRAIIDNELVVKYYTQEEYNEWKVKNVKR